MACSSLRKCLLHSQVIQVIPLAAKKGNIYWVMLQPRVSHLSCFFAPAQIIYGRGINGVLVLMTCQLCFPTCSPHNLHVNYAPSSGTGLAVQCLQLHRVNSFVGIGIPVNMHVIQNCPEIACLKFYKWDTIDWNSMSHIEHMFGQEVSKHPGHQIECIPKGRECVVPLECIYLSHS